MDASGVCCGKIRKRSWYTPSASCRGLKDGTGVRARARVHRTGPRVVGIVGQRCGWGVNGLD